MRELTREEVALLERAVRTQVGGRVKNLEVLPHEQGLILRGRSQTYYAKLLAQQGIMRVSSVPIHANEIEVA